MAAFIFSNSIITAVSVSLRIDYSYFNKSMPVLQGFQ